MIGSKVTTVLCCLCLLIALCLPSLTVTAAGETTYSVADMAGKYKTQGRVYNTGSKLYPDWSASGIEFEADCSGDVYVLFDVERVSTSDLGGCYFTVVVDGVAKGRAFCRLTQTGTQKFKIASGLSDGRHSFALYRQTEVGALVSITGVSLTGTLLAAPTEKELYIEFIGDSITTAYGNLASSSTADSGSPAYTDATQGYAYLTAKALEADFSSVAVQGIGASVGWQSYTMQEMYPKQRYPHNRSLDYEFTRQPDVVVLALGTNDMNRYTANGMTLAEVKQGFADMLAMVRAKNPKADIVWIHGMMLSSSSSLINEVVEEAGGEAKGYYTLLLPQSNSGGNGHPNASQQRTFATQLTAFIRELVSPPTVTTTKATTTKTTTTTTKKTTTTTTKKTTTTTTAKAMSDKTTTTKAPTAAGVTTEPTIVTAAGTDVTTATTTVQIGGEADEQIVVTTTTESADGTAVTTEADTAMTTTTTEMTVAAGTEIGEPDGAEAIIIVVIVCVVLAGGIVVFFVLKKRKT